MVDPVALTLQAAFVLALLLVTWLVLYMGYMAYRARVLREAQATRAPPVDHLAQLREVNAQLARELAQGRDALEKARESVRYGTKG